MSASLIIKDNFLPERISNFCVRKIERDYNAAQYKSANLHDNAKNKNNKFFNRLSRRILEDLDYEGGAFGTVVNSFGESGQPLGPHNYCHHYGRKVCRHALYFMTAASETSGGEIFYSKKKIITDLSPNQNEFTEVSPRNNRLIEAPAGWDRLSRIIFRANAPLLHVNVFTYDE